MNKGKEIEQLRQENATLHEGLEQALMAIDFLQARVQDLERQEARGQPGHRGHHLQQVNCCPGFCKYGSTSKGPGYFLTHTKRMNTA